MHLHTAFVDRLLPVSTSKSYLSLATLILSIALAPAAKLQAKEILKRDPLLWPFAQDSIWNTPIGTAARYTPANIVLPKRWAVTVDEDIIINKPNAPLKNVYETEWKKSKRCTRQGQPILQLPIPNGYGNSSKNPEEAPNHATAVLLRDGETYHQSQPLTVCNNGEFATTMVAVNDASVYGDGTYGAHGGSGLSSVGGAIRLGELVPGGVIRHALKMNLFAEKNLYFDGSRENSYRWPAKRVDRYANNKTYGGKNYHLRMGSLLALKPDFDTSALKTEPARIVARALKNYGAYVVDDTKWDVYGIGVESGPDGSVKEEFRRVWGYELEQKSYSNQWASDMRTIVGSLNVITNNTPNTIGGGGTARVRLAPPFAEPGKGHVYSQNKDSNDAHLSIPDYPVLLKGMKDYRVLYDSNRNNGNFIQTIHETNKDWWSLQWEIEKTDAGFVRIKNRWTNRYLAASAKMKWAEVITVNGNRDAWSQQWHLKPQAGGVVTLVNRWSEYGLLFPQDDGTVILGPVEDSWKTMQVRLIDARNR